MKKFAVSIITIGIVAGALLAAVILKDGQFSAAEAAAGLICLLVFNAVSALLVSRIKKNAAEKVASGTNNLRVLPARESGANAILGKIA
ncbi:MAG: hypothetical protein IJJ85_00765 [Clostridia bacterium]|nr:hypothetical protein [Clostridia bacterium]